MIYQRCAHVWLKSAVILPPTGAGLFSTGLPSWARPVACTPESWARRRALAEATAGLRSWARVPGRTPARVGAARRAGAAISTRRRLAARAQRSTNAKADSAGGGGGGEERRAEGGGGGGDGQLDARMVETLRPWRQDEQIVLLAVSLALSAILF